MLRTKSVPVRIKAAGTHEGTDDGVVEAIVATYDRDSVGDKIAPGAFAKTLKEWEASGDPIPFVWAHDWSNPDAHIGVIEEAKETDEGLWIKARVDLNEPFAAKVYRLLKGRRVKQFSFGYEVVEGAWVDVKSEDGGRDGYYELRELKLFEAGPCLVGANQNTRLEAVKHAPSVCEDRVREIAVEVARQVLTEHQKTSAPQQEPTPEVSEPEPELSAPSPNQNTEWETTHRLLAELTEQVGKLADQISQHPPAATGTAASDDDPGQGKSDAADDRSAVRDVRAEIAGLADLTV